MENITHIKQSLNAFKIIISALQFGGMFLYVGLNLDKVKLLHLQLQKIIDEGAKTDIYSVKYIEKFKDFFYLFYSRGIQTKTTK